MALDRRYRFLPAALLALGLLAVSVLLGGCAVAQSRAQPQEATARPAADFTLPDQDGRIISLKALRGKAVVMDFIYTNCPPDEACPLLTAKLVALQQRLQPAGLSDRIVILSITFDPARDTPEVLKAYAKQFGAELTNWHFLRGDEAQTRAIAKAYGVAYEHTDHGDIGHSAFIMVVDPQGRIRAWEPPGFSGRDLLEVVQQVL